MGQAGERIGVGVIGIGFGRAVHLPALRLDPRVEVAAIAASTAERAGRIAGECGVPTAYGDWRAMLADDRLRAVTVAVPPALQVPIALAALQAGKHVFCEKPLADTSAAAAELAAAAKAAGLANVVDFEFPAIAEWRAAKRLVDSGAIGPVGHVHVNWHVETYAVQKRLASWKTDAAGGGMLMSFLAHTLHYLPWLAGPVDRLRATLHRQADDPGNADTMDQLELQFRSGAYGTVTATCNAPFGTGHRVEIYGEEGAICLENRTRDYLSGFSLTCVNRQGPVDIALEPAPSVEAAPAADSRVRTVAVLMRRFIDWIETGAAARPDFQEGAKVQQLLAAAQRSHAAGAWVEIGEDVRDA